MLLQFPIETQNHLQYGYMRSSALRIVIPQKGVINFDHLRLGHHNLYETHFGLKDKSITGVYKNINIHTR